MDVVSCDRHQEESTPRKEEGIAAPHSHIRGVTVDGRCRDRLHKPGRLISSRATLPHPPCPEDIPQDRPLDLGDGQRVGVERQVEETALALYPVEYARPDVPRGESGV